MSDHTEISTDNLLMDLRLIILRTISETWDNDKSNDHNVKIEELVEQGALNRDVLKLPKPWYLRNILTTLTINQINTFFYKHFNYLNPFENFGVYFLPGSAIWNIYGDYEWSKPEDETITITLPSCEVEWSEYYKAERLMEYYMHFPNFFGSGKRKDASEIKMSLAQGVDFSGNDYNLGVSEDSFLSFGAVVNKLIAVAWDNPEFKSLIDYDEQKEKYFSVIDTQDQSGATELMEFNKTYYSRILCILKEHYNFDFPWAFNMKFVFSDRFEDSNTTSEQSSDNSKLSFWIKETEGSEVKWKWRWRTNDASSTTSEDIIRNSVSLEIPITPSDKQTNVSLALAKYNAIGPAYPFTCS